MTRIARAALIGLLGLALASGVGSKAEAFSLLLDPEGPIDALPGAEIFFDLTIADLIGELNNLVVDVSADPLVAEFFFDAIFEDTHPPFDCGVGPEPCTLLFDNFGSLRIADDAPLGITINVDAKAEGAEGADVLSNTVAVVIQQEPEPPGVPEPATLILLGAGLAGGYLVRRLRRG